MKTVKKDFICSADLLNKDIINCLKNNLNIDCNNLFTVLFSELLNKINNKPQVFCKCTIDKFKKRFNITSDILDKLQIDLGNNNGLILAGGKMIDFFNNISYEDSVCDYDIFTTSFNDTGDVNFAAPWNIEKFRLQGKRIFYNIVYLPHVTEAECDNKKYQFVVKSFCSIEHIIESFDFRTCSICTDGKYIYWIKGTLRDIKNKNLFVQNFPNMTSFNVRLAKYLQKGYNISIADLTVLSIVYVNNLYNKLNSNCSEKMLESIINRNFIYSRDLEYIFEEPVLAEQTDCIE